MLYYIPYSVFASFFFHLASVWKTVRQFELSFHAFFTFQSNGMLWTKIKIFPTLFSLFSLEGVEWFGLTWLGQDNDICQLWKKTASKYHQLTTLPCAWNCYRFWLPQVLILCRDNLSIDAKQTSIQNWAKCTNVKYSDCYGLKWQEKKDVTLKVLINTVKRWFFSGNLTDDTNQITIRTQDP